MNGLGPDLGWVSMPTEEFEQLHNEIRQLRLQATDLQASLNNARQVIWEQHGELQRLRRALSHS